MDYRVWLSVLPQITHYDFLADCMATGMEKLPVCHDATGQKQALRAAIQGAVELFDRPLRSADERNFFHGCEYRRHGA